ncbi:50S ribosomal protein L21 [Pseudothermotoga thermarum]|uniref:Large ribosomal subunit protein bL21 n=1 Tax=Pseudothermotoga thermarum DSM 5069 TaxID=688269 RepID=F7YWL6_9THEM|nr:50S ribosomal protein L21 [Pseudothermotoga thermarum]AEH51998.1 LSU ribosomal protein L21P [Pseudothermotoga thermarum DSM 5069]
MYAIIESGGKQYKVTEGETIAVEKLPQAEGQQVVFDRVLHVSTDNGFLVGQPYLTNCSVIGTIIQHARARKIIIAKYKRKTGYKRRRGHRQWYTLVRIDKIQVG